MIFSMTGFGRATAQDNGRELTVELKAVNHRFLDIGMRLPRSLSFLEETIRNVLAANLSRGHVDVYINYTNRREDSLIVELDEPLLQAYIKTARRAAEVTGLADDISLSAALRVSDVLKIRQGDEDESELIRLCQVATKDAADSLNRMRCAEGEKLKRDLLSRNETIRSLVGIIASRSPMVVQEYREKLASRISEITSVQLDEARLVTETALFADKASIAEELTRLDSHLEHLERLLAVQEPVGRKLDFLIQEYNREINTIGSKSSDLAILNAVVEVKSEIEKIREQAQNIE